MRFSDHPSHDRLIGRDRDLEHIRTLLDPAEGSGTLLLWGEAGVGKSVVLDVVAASAAAAGTRVLRAAGVEFEADVSYSGLNQILFPLRGAFDCLDGPHRDALSVALGFGSGSPPHRLTVCNATLFLLHRLAADQPLLLIIDDLPWIDRASAAVLGFIARRLSGSRVGFLAASRSGTESFFERGRLPEYELSPLEPESARLLMTSRFPGLIDAVRRRLLVAAQGNPLALLELPTALSGSQRAALADLPAVLPLSRRLQALFASRIDDLPLPSRHLLLLATLDGTGDLAVLQAAARQLQSGAHLDDLAAAERHQLVRIGEASRHLTFRHPLICSAMVELSTSSERRAAHRALAEVLVDEPERRAWHLGEAALEPDEQVAGLLEGAARRILRRGDAVGAVRALTRAADLSPLAQDRGRRLGEAAYIGAEVAGTLSRASELLEDARRADPGLKGSLYSASAAAQLILNGDGDLDTAHRLLAGAIGSGNHEYDAGDEALIDALHLLALLSHLGGRRDLWTPLYEALSRLKPKVPPLLSAVCKTFSDPARTGNSAKREIDLILGEIADERDPARIVRAGTASIYVDRLADVREPSWRVVRQGRDGGPVRRYIGGLFHIALDDYLTGLWDESYQLACEGVRVCEDHGYTFFTWYFWSFQALISAARGEYEACVELTDRISGWAGPRGVGIALHYANQARTLADLGRGDFEGAYRHASLISPAGTLASHVPHAMWLAMDVVEAAIRTGRQTEAASHVRAVDEAGMAELSPRLALLAAGAAGVCAVDNDVSVRQFETALAVPGVERWAFDLARVQLAYGERLRRNRATTESRGPLGAALAAFERLKARPWAERAAKELRAAGSKVSHRGNGGAAQLTSQELEIARLAASGLTNREIAQRLMISHRTVSAHLYQIFPKLGITSRASLRDFLESPG
nr:LuxR family transcriptional regulator [Streptomyces sp. S1D4-11]QIZ00754.1 AAA family ATPase [Streptomyces sp. S1D4-11]